MFFKPFVTNFRLVIRTRFLSVDFYAEDAIRLLPYKDDKLKYSENTPFWAVSVYSRLPMQSAT